MKWKDYLAFIWLVGVIVFIIGGIFTVGLYWYSFLNFLMTNPLIAPLSALIGIVLVIIAEVLDK